MTNAFYGLEAKGDWELTIKNTSWSDEFNIYNWKIKYLGLNKLRAIYESCHPYSINFWSFDRWLLFLIKKKVIYQKK